MKSKKTLVLGASPNPDRYSYLAVNKLVKFGHLVVPVGIKEGRIQDMEIINGQPESDDIDTVTLYLNPKNQESYYDYILRLKPNRIIFNPGTENRQLQSLAKEKGIDTLEACTLVMLSTGQY